MTVRSSASHRLLIQKCSSVILFAQMSTHNHSRDLAETSQVTYLPGIICGQQGKKANKMNTKTERHELLTVRANELRD